MALKLSLPIISVSSTDKPTVPVTVFIDTSAYFALLNQDDPHHIEATELAAHFQHHQPVTSQGVLGELLTIGSMRFDRNHTLAFYEKIIAQTQVVTESKELVNQTYELFKRYSSKNISWVDCYSQAIINHYQIPAVFTFDKDFTQLSKL